MPSTILDQGVCECVHEPRGDSGMEGYNLKDFYRFQHCRGTRGGYYRVWHSLDYYECCGPGNFAQWFRPVITQGVSMEPCKHLELDCKPGDFVFWKTLGGQLHTGRLKEWDNYTAVVVLEDGTEQAVRCR